MPHVGSISSFDPESETFESYRERLEEYFIANNIGTAPEGANEATIAAANRRKVAAFNSTIGKHAYAILSDLTKPDKPSTKAYADLVVLLKNHYQPKTVTVAESYRFHRCVQEENETVNAFYVRLRGKADKCDFGTFLNRALRDQFVSGLRSREIQKKLLEEDKDITECLKVANAGETAVREEKSLHESVTVNFVRKKSLSVKPSERKKSSYQCYSCGDSDHKRLDCKFRNAVCRKCKRKGHIARVCKADVTFLEEEETEDEQEADLEFLQEELEEENYSSQQEVNNYTGQQEVNNYSGQQEVSNYSGQHEVNSYSGQEEDKELLLVHSNISNVKSGIKVSINVEGNDCEMLLDTGACRSIIPKDVFDKLCSGVEIKETNVVLKTYTNETVKPLGIANVNVKYQGKCYSLSVLVATTGKTALFGRDWLEKIKLDWKDLMGYSGVQYVNVSDESKSCKNEQSVDLFERYSELFEGELGCYKGEPVELEVTSQPKFFKARPIPFSLRDRVKTSLDSMETEGIIKRVSSSKTAAPIVVVKKKDSDDLRICGDFSVTYNACADLVQYPIPKVEDLHAALRGCSVFSVLDMKSAYHQIPVSENSQKFLTINTIQGLYVFTRLPFGIHSAPGVFQRIMDTVLAGIPKVICYLDDILVAGETPEEHDETLSQVFKRLLDAGFRLSKSKCNLRKPSVRYLGHVIDAKGLHPTEDKMQAIRDAPTPKNVTQLKSFLGLILFYARFIPNHSTLLAPLNALLCKDTKWKWTAKENAAFKAAKDALLNSQTLVHYDESLPLYLACDASEYGVGAVLSHRIDGIDRPIAFASCTLTDAQKNYSQTCKEAFSIMFGLQRFRQFLCGRSFTIITDHKSLMEIFNPSRPVPKQAVARLQRWSLSLASYDYKLEFRNTTAHANADGVSRLPLSDMWNPPVDEVECYFFDDDVVTNVTHAMIKKHTAIDPILSKVYRYCCDGWPISVEPELDPYKTRCDELTVEQGCVLWGTRVIIPAKLQRMVLTELHATHPGSSRMKMLARSYVWWPCLDSAIESMVRACVVCQSMRSEPPKAQIHPWIYPSRPWSRLHIDFAGPTDGKMYFVLIDAYSKFPEIVKVHSTTTEATIKVLREIFSRHGLPEMIVSDNGVQFTSKEFEQFCTNNGILHRTTAVYKPACNGQAERCVRILKEALKQAKSTGQDPDKLLNSYLLTYRNTPHTTTGESPAMLLYGRRLRTRLDLMLPSVRNQVHKSQSRMVKSSNPHKVRVFDVGDSVLARNFQKGEKWLYGKVEKILGNKHYIVQVNLAGVKTNWKRHVDQLIEVPHRENESDGSESSDVEHETRAVRMPVIVNNPVLPNASNVSASEEIVSESVSLNDSLPSGVQGTESSESVKAASVQPEVIAKQVETVRRYPSRIRKEPSYLQDYTK